MSINSRGIWLLAIGLTLCTACVAHANHDIKFNDDDDEDWIEGDFDLHDQGSLRHLVTLSGPFAFRQQFSFAKSGYGIESWALINDENLQRHETAYSLAGLYQLSPTWEVYSGFELSAENTEDGSSEESFDIDSLYALRKFGSNHDYIGIGRQEVEDDRGWMVSEHIDGVSYVRESEQFAVTGFIGSHNQALEKLIGIDEDNHDIHSNLHEYIGYVRVYRSIGDDKQASAYVAYFRDEFDSQWESNLYVGVRSLGSFLDDGSYWVQAALLNGSSESRSISAYAFDAGVSHTWRDLSFKPTFSLGLAFGSGDDGSAADSEFRQTGIHSNETVFGGVVDLKYYGHVLDPQLSNLHILTFGLGFRPLERLSVDILYNGYWQVHPSTEIKTDGIELNANGSDHYVGSGIDLVVGLRNWSQLSISLVYGRFWGNGDINADVGSLEFMWNIY